MILLHVPNRSWRFTVVDPLSAIVKAAGAITAGRFQSVCVSQVGERNRALSVVKSRGMKHSNQVRELILSDQRVALADDYTAGGDVLMGTARKKMKEA